MRQYRSVPRQPIRAFTILELVMVLVALALLAAVAAPRYASSLANYHVDAAARRVAADLAFVQAQARATSKSQTITFNQSGLKYQVSGLSGLDNRTGGYSVDLSADPYCLTGLTAKFAGKKQITFDQYGTPDNAGTVSVAVGTTTKTVTLDAATGKLTLK